MLSYIIKDQHNHVYYKAEILFHDIDDTDNPEYGKITNTTKCWVCNNKLNGYITNLGNSNKYYIYLKCTNCSVKKELYIEKFSVRKVHNKTSPSVLTKKSNPISKSKTEKITSNNVIRDPAHPLQKNNDNLKITPKSTKKITPKKSPEYKNQTPTRDKQINETKTPSTKNQKSTVQTKTHQVNSKNKHRNQFISYKNKWLYNKPILGEANSGEMHKSCCSNKCDKCRARVKGKATQLDERRVSLFWSCENCGKIFDKIVDQTELD